MYELYFLYLENQIIDFKLKIPDGKDLDKEVIIPMNIKEDDIPKKVENIIKDYSLDNSYYEPLLSLMNKLKLDRRCVACSLAFGLKAPYIALPLGFGLIFQGLICIYLVTPSFELVL